MFTLETLKTILVFLVGTPHQALYTAATFLALNFVLDFFRKFEPPKKKMVILKESFKRLLAYLAFIIIATRIDSLAIDELFGWEGSTQFLVCLYILAREIRVILDFIRQQGINVPTILDDRINHVANLGKDNEGVGEAQPQASTDITPENIDAKIQSLKEQLAAIEESRNNDGGDNS